MLLEYWWSNAANAWLVADKSSGDLIASLPDTVMGAYYIGQIFMPEIITHNHEQCDLKDNHKVEKLTSVWAS